MPGTSLHQEIGEEKIIHYNHRMQWIMVYMTRYWISTPYKTYSRDYNGLSFPRQFPDVCPVDVFNRFLWPSGPASLHLAPPAFAFMPLSLSPIPTILLVFITVEASAWPSTHLHGHSSLRASTSLKSIVLSGLRATRCHPHLNLTRNPCLWVQVHAGKGHLRCS